MTLGTDLTGSHSDVSNHNLSSTTFQEAPIPPTAALRSCSTNDTVRDCNDNDAPVSAPRVPTIRVRLHLNNTEATESNKRKSDADPPTSSGKRQKKADTLAQPTSANSVRYAHSHCTSHADHYSRNICMRHWKGTQPGGQGFLCDFESHFKTLSEADKEVRISQPNYARTTLTTVDCLSPSRTKCRLRRLQR